MKTVILAGGMGTRLAEETDVRPKPMVEIGGMPILWHIMRTFYQHGHDEFYVALGYRGEIIKRFFLEYHALAGDLKIDVGVGRVESVGDRKEKWSVHLVETGAETGTGGRLKRLLPRIGSETFFMTYGDCVADIDVDALVRFHKSHGKLATLTAVRPPSRFGYLTFDGDAVVRFQEKPETGDGWINGGFFVLEPGVGRYIAGDSTFWEREPLEAIARDGQLMAYRHGSFWQPMDTIREVRLLREMWESGRAPWKVWK
ncbi:MAG: glucose-1-phosphate cytidylyltransferase [Chloroflexi bacterium]|nr:glucose-1-phosphate cytidylyltransferase [Chloroflexota bacterium]